MNRHQLQTNLDGLCQNLEDYAEANGIQASKPPSPAPHLSDSLYLAHSTSDTNFSDICASGRLRPAISPRPDCAEVLLGTAGSVFFFVSPFRYPSTSCGLLFAKSLESDYGATGLRRLSIPEVCSKYSPGTSLSNRRVIFYRATNCRFRGIAAISAYPWISFSSSRGITWMAWNRIGPDQ
jgi:hypothetical protein